ncbi:bifunctional diaminohydroxyphosphoribosylaminopyrimidine deaminase/5-amino-6-(5-phosphoribosylamino)uracil reductase RibD [Neobacillus niacini]|uniref:bifunctional diaminohydroxyphosphoribosylaminopyrimidine deaminase/5-amino-6-(5-phosphoribosylamino)uracil reductase RibD n=1 Tax=Neobacillus niacini TaxID=86668 RepID=UPI002854806F|nr:bifunctional diaminohydroxyphosphoribosylaminopyrimidine deaminase/5-amino-6-(5-phosphoribosylamino)uracil reductase RibD [Neobacillus niacini]MDR7001834.1 diaminohydroxyphosphoribosylaminopyrimidine deaminase/5-amino-6-(5-phosphoribosylamino)uracil reductase [Neobacillus niacini]
MNDTDYMNLAVNLAKSTLGQTAPNPVVGAVVVKDHQIVGMGAHLKAGQPHAEVHAIQMAGEKVKDATMYVTLEPCSHYGKTPPCSDLVIRTGIKKVFVATTDPNPQVAGKGIERIRKAGIEVEVGLLQEEARELNKVFFYNISTGLPYVTLKSAISLDGKTATVTGASKWITGEEARQDVHELRHQHDAILVGVNTVIKDNPSLTTRLPSGGKNPIRIILDTGLRTPVDANVVTDGLAPTWIITGSGTDSKRERVYQDLGVKLIKLPEGQINIREMLKVIGEMGITSLFVEGGAEVHGSFLKERAFQQVITYIAPKLIGGKLAPASFGGEGFETMEEIVSLKIKEVDRIGNDIRIIAEPK